MPRTQPPIHRPRLPINITALVTPQEQSHSRHLVRHAPSLQRIQLPNLPLRPPLPRHLVHQPRHSRLNNPRTNRIHPHPCARKLVAQCLRKAHDPRLCRAVVGSPRIAAQPRRRRSHDDGAARVRLRRSRPLHRQRSMFRAQKRTQQISPDDTHEVLSPQVLERRGPDDAGVGEHDVHAAVRVQRGVDHVLDGVLVCGIEFLCVYRDGGVVLLELALVCREVFSLVVEEVEGAGAIGGEEVGGGATDTEGRVGAGYEDDFIFYAAGGELGDRKWGGGGGEWLTALGKRERRTGREGCLRIGWGKRVGRGVLC